jgi:hypothetical protein
VCIAGCRPNGAGGNGCDTGSGFSCVVPDGGTEGRCTKGCANDGDCSGATPKCDLNTNKCVQCTGANQCPNGQICDLNKNICGDCTLNNTANCDPTGSGGACLPNNTCGCKTDSDCSGQKVCDPTTKICVTGCRTSTGCQPGDICDSLDGGIGQCSLNDGGLDAGNQDAGNDAGDGGDSGVKDSGTDSGSVTPPDSGTSGGGDAGDGGILDQFAIEGGGCDCNVLGVGNGPAGYGSIAALGLAAATILRRRRRK